MKFAHQRLSFVLAGTMIVLFFFSIACKSKNTPDKKEGATNSENVRKLTVPKFKTYSWIQTNFIHPDSIYAIEHTAIIQKAEVRPYSRNVVVSHSDKVLKFKLPAAGHYVAYLNDFKVCIFAEPKEIVPTGTDVVVLTGCNTTGTVNETAKLQQAINDIAGTGKTLFFPKGKYLTNQLRIKDKIGVKLYLERGAEIVMDTLKAGLTSTSVRDIFGTGPSTIPNGKTNWTESRAFILIDNSKNVEFKGYGTFNGRGRAARRNAVVENGSESNGRFRNFLITRSENVLIDGIVSADPGTWNTHVILSKDVTCRNMKLLNELNYAPIPGNLNNIDYDNINTDGFDIDASTNTLIQDCFGYCADDNIAVKTSEYCGLLGPLDGLLVERCVFLTQKSSLKVGTETGGAYMNNIIFRNNDVIEADRALALYCYDGAVMENILYKNNRIEENHPNRNRAVVFFEIKPRQVNGLVGKASITVEDTYVHSAFPNNSRIIYSNTGAANSGGKGSDLQVQITNFYIEGKKITNITDQFNQSGGPAVSIK